MKIIRSFAPLSLIAIALACGGLLRLSEGVGAAFALQTTDEATLVTAAPLQCPEPPERLVEALKERDRTVSAQEALLRERLSALELAEKALSARLEELTQAEESLAATLAIADSAAEDDLARLTAVYEAMKPTEAAGLFQAMSPDFAAGFLGRMRPDAAAAILAGLPPDTAYSISVLVAGRNARAPKE